MVQRMAKNVSLMRQDLRSDYQMKNEIIAREALDNTKYITSIEIAELTGKMHKHVMEAIRKMEPAWESERGTNFRLSQIREKISNNGYNRLPDVFTKEDVIRCFGYDNDSSARGKIKRLVDDGIISKEDAVDENGNTSSIYKKVKLMI